MENLTKCPLCESEAKFFFEHKYLRCPECDSIFKHHKLLPSLEEEKKRYTLHNNDVHDPKYQKFVSPIVDAIFEDFVPDSLGLDFGCGSGPVLSKVLSDNGFDVLQYDPLFCNNKATLEKKYDYIVCCEVIEHFHKPNKEFTLLRNLLKEGGKLYCKTHPFDESIDFETWYYKEDETHVFFYQEKTLEWIQKSFGFASVTLDGRIITFTG